MKEEAEDDFEEKLMDVLEREEEECKLTKIPYFVDARRYIQERQPPLLVSTDIVIEGI